MFKTIRRVLAALISVVLLLLPVLSFGEKTDLAVVAKTSESIPVPETSAIWQYCETETAVMSHAEVPVPVTKEYDDGLTGKQRHLLAVLDDSGEAENGCDIPIEDDSGELENGCDIPCEVSVKSFVYYAGYYKVSDNRHYKIKLSRELQEYTWEKCLEYGVPFKIIMGIMGVESGWTADIGVIENASGTYVGLGMLSEKHNAEYFANLGIDIYEPEGNIEALCSAFRDKLELFDFNVHYALIAYNQGNGGARSFIAEGKETSSYSRLVMQYSQNLLTQEEYDAID